MAELRQRIELRKLLVPELRQSLNILALPLLDIRQLIETELQENPFLEEIEPEAPLVVKLSDNLPPMREKRAKEEDVSALDFVTQPVSLYEALYRQLAMFTESDLDFRIGDEIIGNIDDNGYLKISIEEISLALDVPVEKARKVLALIHKFEPAGIGARTVAECLLIQLAQRDEREPLMEKIITGHLEDVARKNLTAISRALNQPLERIEPLVKKIATLDPKPGRNYCVEEARRIIPDVVVSEKDEEELQIAVNNEDIPTLALSDTYKKMLKDDALDPRTKLFLKEKQERARDLLRAISKRAFTLRRIIEAIIEEQPEAVRKDLSHLKPMTFETIAVKLEIHPSTVCRAIMNKYVRLPYGVVALKDFFSSHIHDKDGNTVSATHIKRLITELIEAEDTKHPFSDQDVARMLFEKSNMTVSRRTVSKYREQLKIQASSYRRVR